MAIHDVSKDTGDRSQPQPNRHDTLEGLHKAHGTESANFVTATTGQVLTAPITGGRGGGSVNITNSGSTTPPRGAPPLQFIKWGQAQVGGSSNVNWATIPHGLSFVPSILAYLNQDAITIGSTVLTTSGSIPLPLGNLDINNKLAGAVVYTAYLEAFTDNTNVYLLMANATGGDLSFVVTYYLYQQPATATT